MKSAIVERDLKPDNVQPDVELVIRREVDPRRYKRIGDILADILDNGSTPGEGRKS